MELSKEVIIAPHDFVSALQKKGKFVLIWTIFFGLLFFTHKIQKPICYSAAGTFKSNQGNSVSNVSKAIETLVGSSSEKYSSGDDPKYFLSSYPVLKKVVLKLGLQGTIHEIKQPNRFQRLLYNLQAERIQKTPPPPSQIVNSKGSVSSRKIFPDNFSPITCKEIQYPLETSTTLKIHFLNTTDFHVFSSNSKQTIGKGSVDLPFEWDGGSFTLTTEKHFVSGDVFHLTLLPLDQVVADLAKQIQIKADKENSSLIYLKYYHPNRFLAADIVNTTMREFQNYIKEEGRIKAANQLDYLKQRHEDSIADLEAIMNCHREDLEKHLGSGGMISLNQELEFFAREQSSYQGELLNLSLEMKRLYQSWHGEEMKIDEILKSIKELPFESEKEIQALSLESAMGLLAEHQKRLDSTQIELEHYGYALNKIDEPQFDCSSLSQIINDSLLSSHFEKLNSLHHSLVDVKNWSTKERQTLQEEIDIEKVFLKKHVIHLKEGGIVKASVAKERIQFLQQEVLKLLYARYEAVAENLKNLALKVSDFPQKWLAEQKIEMNKKIHAEIIESITKLIEAKNISYNTEYLSSFPLQFASYPIIPNPPRLVFFFILGCGVGLCLSLLYVFLREIYLGPSASFSNLITKNKTVLGVISNPSPFPFQQIKTRDFNTIRHVANFSSEKKALFLSSQMNSYLPQHLLSLLVQKGKKCLFLDAMKNSDTILEDLSNNSFESSIMKEKKWDFLPFGIPSPFPEQVYESDDFKAFFNQMKDTYDCIVIWNYNAPQSLETKILSRFADQTIFLISYERLHELTPLPSNTAYLIQELHENHSINLALIKPFLDRVKKQVAFSFSWIQESLNTFSKSQ